MDTERLDCNWCGSARSIEHGICQVCLMEYPLETKILQLPLDGERRPQKRHAVVLDPVEAQKSTASKSG